MQLPATQPTLAFDQPTFLFRFQAHPAPIPSDALSSRRPAPKRIREAGRASSPALGFLRYETRALGRELREVRRVIAYLVRALPAAIAQDISALIALACFLFAGSTAAAILTGQVSL
jgi:hypothetical protein